MPVVLGGCAELGHNGSVTPCRATAALPAVGVDWSDPVPSGCGGDYRCDDWCLSSLVSMRSTELYFLK